MANYSTLKAAVADVVKTNGTRAITGANLQSVLLSIINSVGGGGYIFKGVATPSTSAGTPDQNVFYIGGAGTYANFGTSITVPVGSICIFKYNGSWTKEQIALFAGIDDVPTAGSNNPVKSGGVYSNILQNGARFLVTSHWNGNTIFPNFDTTEGTLTFPNDSWVFIAKSNQRYTMPTTPVPYTTEDTSLMVLVFNYNTGTLSFQGYNYVFGEYDILLAVIRKLYGTTTKRIVEVNACFNYTVDGNPFNKLQQNVLESDKTALTDKINVVNSRIGIGFISDVYAIPNINTINKVLDLGIDPVLFIGNKHYVFLEIFPNNPEYYREIPIYTSSSSGAIKLLFNLETKRIYPKIYSASITDKEIVIGSFRLEYLTHNFIRCNLPFDYTIDGNPFTKQQQNEIKQKEISYTYSYQGEVLPINNCTIKTVFKLSDFGTTTYPVDSQGMDIFDDKFLFQGNQSGDTRSIYVLDLEQKSILGNFLFEETGSWHMNNFNCAQKEVDTDKFPLIYISECYGQGRCAVVKINDTADGYTIKQLITFNTVSHYGGGTYPHDWFIDLANNFIYCYGSTSSTFTYNKMIEIVKFNLPALTNSTVTFTDNDVLDYFTIDNMSVYQGSKIINNRLVCPVGYGNTESPAFIKVIDLSKKQIVTTLPWAFGEPESVGVYKKGLLVANNAINPTYRLITL